ncbi:MAG: TrkH family potassium uptake protein [Candidatus Bipolaricaulota bacterium]
MSALGLGLQRRRPVGVLRVVLRNAGILSPAVGIMALISIPVALAWGEQDAVTPLMITAGLSFALSGCLYIPFRRAPESRTGEALITCAVAFLVISLVGALPFVLIARNAASASSTAALRDPANAVFESISGLSTTGLTMVTSPEDLPRILQWWRSFLQWVGGLGIVVFMLTLVTGLAPPTARSLYYTERDERVSPSIRASVRSIGWIYTLYTAVGAGALWASGLSLWDASNAAMTALSTGGFASTSRLLTSGSPAAVQVILCVLMVAGATNFAAHYLLLTGRLREFVGNAATRWLFASFGISCALLFLANTTALSLFDSARLSIFQAISASTTTGFQSADIRSWPDLSKLLLVGAMFVGGAAGSTAGGIKVIRLLLVVQGTRWWIRKMGSSAHAVFPLRVGREVIPHGDVEERVVAASTLVLLWIALYVLAVLIVLPFVPAGFSLSDVMFEVMSAQATTGLSTGLTQPSLPLIVKFVLAICMWLGRIELLPAFVMLRAFARRRG